VADSAEAARLTESGAVDVSLEWAADPPTVTRWRADPALRDRMFLAARDEMKYVALNVAVPPFDDVALRRAVNLVIDREALAAAATAAGSRLERPLMHSAVDSLENNLLATWSPPGVEPGGDLSAARAAMATSRYDHDHDGRCDADVCGSLDLYEDAVDDPGAAISRLLSKQLSAIGLYVRPHLTDLTDDASALAHSHPPMILWSWIKDFPSGGTFLPQLASGESVSPACCNFSLLGASRAQLKKLGYATTKVPSVDPRIQRCQQQLFQAQVQCWASLDQYLSADLVPIVPLTQTFDGWAVSSRVGSFTVDAAVPPPAPSLGAITVSGESAAPAPSIQEPTPASSIPDGVYTTTVTSAELKKLFPVPDFDEAVAGTYTLLLEEGRFSLDQVHPGHQVWDPMQVGTYAGTEDTIVFSFVAPYWVTEDVSPLRWRLEGQGLRFTMRACTARGDHRREECAFQTAVFTGAPWEPVGR